MSRVDACVLVISVSRSTCVSYVFRCVGLKDPGRLGDLVISGSRVPVPLGLLCPCTSKPTLTKFPDCLGFLQITEEPGASRSPSPDQPRKGPTKEQQRTDAPPAPGLKPEAVVCLMQWNICTELGEVYRAVLSLLLSDQKSSEAAAPCCVSGVAGEVGGLHPPQS